MEGEGGRVCHPTDRPRSGDPVLHAGPGRLPDRGRPVHRPAARQARRKAPGGPPWLNSVTGRETSASKPTSASLQPSLVASERPCERKPVARRSLRCMSPLVAPLRKSRECNNFVSYRVAQETRRATVSSASVTIRSAERSLQVASPTPRCSNPTKSAPANPGALGHYLPSRKLVAGWKRANRGALAFSGDPVCDRAWR